jgi:hypothetical protein
MKNLYAFILLLTPVAACAQRNVDLDRYNFTVQYRSLPALKLDSTYHTYNVEIEGTKLMQPLLNQMDPAKTVSLEGWRKLESIGHITMHVKLDDMLPESVSVKERIENITDKNGKITGTRSFYYEEVIYTFAATASVHDYKGVHIMDEVLAERNYKQTYKSPEFAVRALAQSYFAINALRITNNLYQSCVNRAMYSLSEKITENFGFRVATVNDYMWIVDSKKDPEYIAHRQAFLKLNEVLFAMNASTPIDEARKQLKPVIDYFESVKKMYTSSRKHDRKIRYASYYNLAVLYYYLDDPQSMMNEAIGLELNDFDTRDARGFKLSAGRLKNIFEQTNIYTRHFAIDTSLFKGPFEKNAVTVTK